MISHVGDSSNCSLISSFAVPCFFLSQSCLHFQVDFSTLQICLWSFYVQISFNFSYNDLLDTCSFLYRSIWTLTPNTHFTFFQPSRATSTFQILAFFFLHSLFAHPDLTVLTVFSHLEFSMVATFSGITSLVPTIWFGLLSGMLS